jgi:hypothetical protein
MIFYLTLAKYLDEHRYIDAPCFPYTNDNCVREVQ